MREGLDIPEVSLVAILDADKEGFLRSETSLTQTCGRAARNAEGRVIMYADKITGSIQRTLDVTRARRTHQEEYNRLHGITPKTIIRSISSIFEEEEPKQSEVSYLTHSAQKVLNAAEEKHHYLTLEEVQKQIKECESEMRKSAKEMRFEEAAKWRDKMRTVQEIALTLA